MKPACLALLCTPLLTLGLTSCSMTQPAGPEVSTPGSPTMQQANKTLPQFIARGNEPFWSINVRGTTLTWITPENPQGTRLSAQRQASGDALRYVGMDGNKAFMLEMVGEACTDSMSGQSFPFTATWLYAGERNPGCAEQRTEQ